MYKGIMEAIYRNNNLNPGARIEKGMQVYRRSVAWAGRQFHCTTPVLALLATRWFQAVIAIVSVLLLYSGSDYIVPASGNSVGTFQGSVFRLAPISDTQNQGTMRDVAMLRFLLNKCSIQEESVRRDEMPDGSVVFVYPRPITANGWVIVNRGADGVKIDLPRRYTLQTFTMSSDPLANITQRKNTANFNNGFADGTPYGNEQEMLASKHVTHTEDTYQNGGYAGVRRAASESEWKSIGSSTYTWSRDGRNVVLLGGATQVFLEPFGETVMDMSLPWQAQVSTGVSCICSGTILVLTSLFAAFHKENKARVLFYLSFLAFSLCNGVAAVGFVVDGKLEESFMCFVWGVACVAYPYFLFLYERLFVDLSVMVGAMLLSGVYTSVHVCMHVCMYACMNGFSWTCL